MPESADPCLAVESVARNSYGRLIACLAARTGDVAAAEDALGEALVGALRSWPSTGVPENPEAWLLKAARRRLIDEARHHAVRARHEDAIRILLEEQSTNGAWADERLGLLFVCAHPAIDPAVRAPLMLQTVLGIDAEQIASAFLTSPTAMSQRLVRAKLKIREARIPFQIPDQAAWPERIAFVLDAIYAAYGTGWEDPAGVDSANRSLNREALELGRMLVSALPDEAEPRGLLALMLFCESRTAARRSPCGSYVSLPEQNPADWFGDHIDEAERHLAEAARRQMPGRYQLEAAIQSVHAERRRTQRTAWESIVFLYQALIRISPSLGASVGLAVARGEQGHPAHGLAELDALPTARVESYQPFWAARAHLLKKLERTEEAAAALQRAIGLTTDPVVRRFLSEKGNSR